MKRSRSLATAAGVTLAVAGAVSALFLTVGAGASSLVGSDSSSSDSSSDSSSTVPTTATTGTTIDDLSDAEVYTLDENGRLIPFDDSRSNRRSSTTVPGRDDNYDDSYHDDDRYEDHEHDDDHYDDDRYEDHDDSYHDDDRYEDHEDDDDHYDDSYHDNDDD